MSPSELKKLRNKQKKAKRKAEAEKANAQQAQQRKEAHNKSQKRGPGGEGDELDTPQKDELLPEKLERPHNPLEEAAKFLIPLQNLAKQDIDTQFAAFEIFYRKGKILISLTYQINNTKINIIFDELSIQTLLMISCNFKSYRETIVNAPKCQAS